MLREVVLRAGVTLLSSLQVPMICRREVFRNPIAFLIHARKPKLRDRPAFVSEFQQIRRLGKRSDTHAPHDER